jgi:4'-phosphopantetheinyl transferase EntD
MKITLYNFGSLRIYAINLNELRVFISEEHVTTFCNPADYKIWLHMNNEKRKLEFLATRYLLSNLNLYHDFFYEGRIPKLKSGQNISISHAQEWAVVALSNTHKIGVDIELIQEKVALVYTKFVHSDEQIHFNVTNLKQVTLLWSFKESVYKLMQIPSLVFSEHIRIQPQGREQYIARIHTAQGNFEVLLGFHILGDHTLTFTIGDVQKQT